MFGDTMLANGLVYPFKEVGPGKYRFRLLNACNARFLRLQFVVEDPAVPGEPLLKGQAVVPAAVTVTQIGTEGGFLQTPVVVINAGVPALAGGWILGPAERADIIVDFSAVPAGQKVILYNDAPAPFPGGAAIFDFFPGNKKTAAVYVLGSGPNTRTIMQFRNTLAAPAAFTTPTSFAGQVNLLPTALDPAGGFTLGIPVGGTFTDITGKTYAYNGKVQNLTLNEVFDAQGRLMQLVGTTTLQTLGLPVVWPNTITYGQLYADGLPSEKVQYNTIEIWNIINLTADTHPMHVHLFNAQILQRRAFNVRNFAGIPTFNRPGVGPDLNEVGMKETFRTNPGEVTRLGVLVEDPMPSGSMGTAANAPMIGRDATGRPTVTMTDPATLLTQTSTLPPSARLATYGTANGINWTNTDEYVWHCHILEHEEHDMMRVLGAAY
jgi:spore coat protein A